MRERKSKLGLIALSVGAYVALVLPLQTYLANATDYGFGLGRLLGEQALLAVVVAVVAFALLCLSERWLNGWLAPVLVAILVCLHLETGPLSFGLPELNGELPRELKSVSRATVDGIVLLAVVASLVGTFRWNRSWLHLLASGLLLMGGASLLDVRQTDERVDGGRAVADGRLEAAEDIIRSFHYSRERNVLLLVLDSMPASDAARVMERDAALARHFPGFTAYRDNIGMHTRTRTGVVGLMTGNYLGEQEDLMDYKMSVFGPDSILRHCQGYDVFCMIDYFTYGFTNVDAPASEKVVAEAPVGPAVFRNSTEVPGLSLSEVCVFRLLPFAFKGKYLDHVVRAKRVQSDDGAGFEHECFLFPHLAKCPVGDGPRPVFAKFHSHGSHSPFYYDADGLPVRPAPEQVLFENSVSNCLVHLSRLMDSLRQRGLYDKSFIVVAADHGASQSVPAPGREPKASALLWVKPDGADAPFRISDLPTSHAKVAPLLKQALAHPVDGSRAVDGALRSEKRVYQTFDRKTGTYRKLVY